jgi:arginyl-tRNA synthetase
LIEEAAHEFNPSAICNYTFKLAQTFNSFYDEHSIAKAESEEKKQLRLMLATMTANTLQSAMAMLGIEVPQKM